VNGHKLGPTFKDSTATIIVALLGSVFLIVPFAHTATKQNRAFSVVDSSLWNGLSLALRLFLRIASNSFLRSS